MNESIGSDEGERRSAYKSAAANHILPVIPEKGDASKILRDKSLLRYGNGINKRKTAASQPRLAVENVVANGRYQNVPQTAQNDVGQKIDQKERLLTMVKQSPYSNAMSHATLAVAGGIVMGADANYSPGNNNRDLQPSMSVDRKLQQLSQ